MTVTSTTGAGSGTGFATPGQLIERGPAVLGDGTLQDETGGLGW